MLSGCASKYVEPEQYSGFLKNYSVLKEDKSPSGAPVMRWIQPGVDVNRFTSVYVEPSQLYPQPQPTEKIPQSTLQGITSYYDQALQTQFAKALPLASGPGPGVLVVRPAITGVSASTKGLQPYEVIPIALVAAGVSAATGIRDQDTSIATEAAFLDGGTNEVVAEVVRKGAGTELDNSSQVMKASDARAVLDGWAMDMLRSFQALKK
ncbi:putative lipoprotein [Pseudomonas citronellolis]|nr:putative lipoprotein [Pseudomonas citronellolis]